MGLVFGEFSESRTSDFTSCSGEKEDGGRECLETQEMWVRGCGEACGEV